MDASVDSHNAFIKFIVSRGMLAFLGWLIYWLGLIAAEPVARIGLYGLDYGEVMLEIDKCVETQQGREIQFHAKFDYSGPYSNEDYAFNIDTDEIRHLPSPITPNASLPECATTASISSNNVLLVNDASTGAEIARTRITYNRLARLTYTSSILGRLKLGVLAVIAMILILVGMMLTFPYLMRSSKSKSGCLVRFVVAGTMLLGGSYITLTYLFFRAFDPAG